MIQPQLATDQEAEYDATWQLVDDVHVPDIVDELAPGESMMFYGDSTPGNTARVVFWGKSDRVTDIAKRYTLTVAGEDRFPDAEVDAP